ncbi:ribbon-helix-helix protein, CopG family [Adlercreutzia sp. ZJ242]|uniref:ribbon-helix-helix protein, CopG family n=1 Tax=Adlercreutzia sp. ZJ242 TaxID=2709409 RepID=UPI0013EAF582|nr:ribbon-helix-helix protein, CopG family [Adlercreutzia sp. ZJ242]
MEAVVLTDKDLMEKLGMTREEIEQLKRDADAYDRGEWPEAKSVTVRYGRPPLFEDDELVSVTFKIGRSQLKRVDEAVKEQGCSRSEFLRCAVEDALGLLESEEPEGAGDGA